ncbi:hypothetical protein AGMMS49928_28950 [Spirochaetia bacterium]|nr:hypothetical protein AGMMS49928_28950 [Spirochaetia bacterium]
MLIKARELADAYEQATDCGIRILDQNGEALEKISNRDPFSCCESCDKYCGECERLRLKSIDETQRRGDACVYTCESEFVFWVCPVYYKGHHIGSLFSGGLPSHEKTSEEILSLARLLRLCAEQLSNGENHFVEKTEAGTVRVIHKNNSAERMDFACSLEKERILLATLRRGDREAGLKILDEILENVLVLHSGNIDFFKLRAIELAVLLSRAAAEADDGEDAGDNALETGIRWLRRIQESETIEEISGNLHNIVERMAGELFSFKGFRHASALRKAERYIWDNYTRKISLKEIAGVAGLSPPYFSSIFKEEMKENFSAYLNRLRVEKAASMMMETALPLNEIALSCGFEDQSWFSKIFKICTGMSPAKYRGKSNETDKEDEGDDYHDVSDNS